ncbi:MAG: DUF1552 domain-containing protein [Sandaracinaceae bacterium]
MKAPIIDRRRFLTALGLGGASLVLPSLGGRTARAGDGVPTRVVFFITPHGAVPSGWQMQRMGEEQDYAYDLASVPESEWSPILRPLYRHRQRLLAINGLASTTSLAEVARVQQGIGHDANAHHVCQAHLLTADFALQRPGSTAIGGTRTLDLVLGDEVGVPGRWTNRVYGYRHQHPYSYVASGEPAPRESDPGTAFQDIMGLARPTPVGEPSRDDRIDMARASVLDLAAAEYEALLPQLGAEDRAKLDRHRQLIRDLEVGLTAPSGPGPAICDPRFSETGTPTQQFFRLISLALSCDLTRVVTFVTDHLDAEDFGAPPGINIHQDIAHASTPDTSGYSPTAEQQMIDYNVVYAEQFAELLDALESVPENGETVLDHTAVVWLTELATGTHWQHRLPHVVAGSACGYFRTGQYVHFAQNQLTAQSWGGRWFHGPGHNRLYVNLLHAMGLTDRDSFGLREVDDIDGGRIDLTGPLPFVTA